MNHTVVDGVQSSKVVIYKYWKTAHPRATKIKRMKCIYSGLIENVQHAALEDH